MRHGGDGSTGAGFVTAFARRAAEVGGRVYEVGGAVRDRLLGREPRDTDLEVYGLDTAALEALIAEFGTVRRVGARLGVYVLQGVEIALPQGPGGVEDPHLAPREAARRRDLTVNALLRDPLSGVVEDFFGGRADLERRRLRHVDHATFAEDPLRLLRVARYHAELGFAVDPATAALCRTLSLDGIAWERIGQEWRRWLLRADAPGRGLDALVYTGTERHFPLLHALRGCPQEPAVHPEGDVWTHTAAVLDAAARRRTGEAERDWPLMLAALLHDVGKPDATARRRGQWRASGHAAISAAKVPLFLHGLDRGQRTGRLTRNLVAQHGAVERLYRQGAGRPAYRRLAVAVDSDLLLRLAEADYAGRAGEGAAFAAGERARAVWEAEDILGRAPTPLLAGADLRALGVPEGPALGEWLEAVYQRQLDGEITRAGQARHWVRQRLAGR